MSQQMLEIVCSLRLLFHIAMTVFEEGCLIYTLSF